MELGSTNYIIDDFYSRYYKMKKFKLISDFYPRGDQPKAIKELTEGILKGLKYQTLLGVTGSGKTFVIANVIERVQKPVLVISHNKTLAAQLYSEFRAFFPENAVEYFVSYYDYYQPEAYVPQKDLYIEKDASINEKIEKFRLRAMESVLTRRDVIVVSSVSCIYGLSPPEVFRKLSLTLRKGSEIGRNEIASRLVDMQYERNDYELALGRFRIRGDVVEVYTTKDVIVRVELFDNEVERILEVDPITGNVLNKLEFITIYPAKQFVWPKDLLDKAIESIRKELEERLNYFRSHGKLLEAQRLETRTNYDIEMLRETGYCSGIENYSIHFSNRMIGDPPFTLLDYFPSDFITIIDESHVTIPQLRAMYRGDYSRKKNLVDFGWRLPSAYENRPLRFEEFESKLNQVIFVSATPGPYERTKSQKIVELIIRPTGLVDPEVIVRPTKHQIDDLISEIRKRITRNERVLVTTLTKRMAENLANYLEELGIKVHYLHSEIETLKRAELLRDLRLGKIEVIVGVNLLREGLDLPEVSLMAILDADKEGFLRSETALIQMIGRVARNVFGQVIMYADRLTDSMRRAIEETRRRRKIQLRYNKLHGITPQTIRKEVRVLIEEPEPEAEATTEGFGKYAKDKIPTIIANLEQEMWIAAQNLDFERAARIRDKINKLKKLLEKEKKGRKK